MNAIDHSKSISSELLQALSDRFDEAELQTLCFQLNIDYDDLRGAGKASKARELVLYLDRHDRILTCIDVLRQLRPDIHWTFATEPPLPPLPMPSKTYDHFIGRAREIERIATALREPDKHQITAIYGMGGIGKTALAREAADLLLREGRFQQVVWISAKAEKFEGVGVEKIPVSDLTFDTLLDQIIRQCHLPAAAQQPPLEKLYSIQATLASRPILLVLDNLETVPEGEALVSRVSDLLRGPSKALLTSRHEFLRTNAYTLRLGGLDQSDGIAFLQEEGRSRDMPDVITAPEEALAQIHQVTGGAPLAMKLLVGQLSRQPLEVVLQSLKAVTAEGQDYEFYRFVFKHSWSLLTPPACQALVSMSVFDPATGGQSQLVFQVSRLNEMTFYRAMDELIAMSLVDYSGGLGRQRYTLHPLTYYFILSDIVKKWSSQP
jgi:hypothetical protein